MANTQRQIQVAAQMKELAAMYFERESSGASIITITNVTISPDLKYCTLFISVIPDTKADAALDFAKRMLPELRTSIKKKLRTSVFPFFSVELDLGEKNRQRIDEIGFGEKLKK
jgi:ribosome-binding factor A